MHRLARLAGIRHRDAVAIVEMLHHWTAKYAIRGDAGRHEDAELAAALEWEASDGTPEQIVSALAGAGWLDRDPVHRLLVHDWPEHCDPFVHMALARGKQTFADGEVPKRARIGGEERKQLDLFWHAFEQQRIAPGAALVEPQPELLPDEPIRAHAVRTPCALPTPTPSPSPSPDPERESDARERGFGPGEDTQPPEELGDGERAVIKAWAMTFAPSRLSELIQLEQLCLAYYRREGKRSSDWVNDVKLWILREEKFEKPPPAPRSRPPDEARALSRERSDRADLEAKKRRNQLDEWKREKAEAEPESISEAREECRRRMNRYRASGSISLDAWVDRKAASG